MRNIDRENLVEELELHKLEYTALRNELTQLDENSRQYLNLILIAIGAALGFFPFILEKRLLATLLVYPFLFHVLFQQMLSASRKWWQIESYISLQLIPRINSVLDELDSKRKKGAVLEWETNYFSHVLRTPKWNVASIMPIENWVPVITIIGLLLSYTTIATVYHYSITRLEIVLLFINVLSLLFVILQSSTIARSEMHNSQKLAKINDSNESEIFQQKEKTMNRLHKTVK